MTWLHNSYLSHNLLRRDNLTADISFIYCFKRYYIIHTLHIPLMYIRLMYILSTFFFFPFFFLFHISGIEIFIGKKFANLHLLPMHAFVKWKDLLQGLMLLY